MNATEKILAIALGICIIFLLYSIITRKGIDYDSETCQEAKQDCWDTFNQGTKRCIAVSDGNNNTFIACSIPVVLQLWACWDNIYPPCPLSYALRNGSVYPVYFYRSDGTFIDYRDGWSPYSLPVKDTDFPITASICSTFGDPDCTVDNGSEMTIKDPGCYVVWYFGGLYTTDEICYGT